MAELSERRKKREEQKKAKQKATWLKNLEPVFDMDYISSKKHMLDSLNDGVYISGLDKIKELKLNKNTRIRYVSEHLSEDDFIEIPKIFLRENIDLPAIFGGANLLVKGLTQPSFFIKHPLVLDIKKSGTILIDRKMLEGDNKANTAYKRLYLKSLISYVETEDHNFKDSILERFDTLIFNFGRSRDGKVRDYEFGTLSLILYHALKHPDLNQYISPISISLERCIEDSSFDIQNLIKNSRLPRMEKLSEKYKWAENINNNWIKQTDKWGAIADIMSFLVFYLRKQPRGEIYLDFGKPISLNAYTEKEEKDLMHDISQSINSNIRITPTSLVSLILKEHPKHYISHSSMLNKINAARKNFPPDVLLSNYLKEDKTDEEVLSRALLFLNEKRNFKAMPYFPIVDTYRIRKQSFLIKYYSNRIEHHNLDLNNKSIAE